MFKNIVFTKNNLFAGWATLVLGLLSAVILISIGVAIVKGNNNQESSASSTNPNHQYRPVSVLQRFQPLTENIPMQVRPGGTSFADSQPRQIRVERKDLVSRPEQTNGYNRYIAATSSGRQVQNENQRPYVELQKVARDDQLQSHSRNQKRTVETRKPKPKQRQASARNVPPEGLVRSVSGSLRQYV